MTGVRLVSFDFWSTLARGNPAYKRRRVELVAAAFGCEPEAVQRALAAADDEIDGWTARTGAHHGASARLRRTAALLSRPEPDAALVSTVEDQLDAAFLHDLPELTEPDLPATLARLRRPGIQLAITSNTGFVPGRVMRAMLARIDLLPLVDHLVFSDEVGHAKPSPRVFRHLTAAAGCAPGEALHVGDDRRVDVEGARAAGLRALWYRPDAGPDGDAGAGPDGDAGADVLRRHEDLLRHT